MSLKTHLSNWWLKLRYPFLIPRQVPTGKRIKTDFTELDFAMVPDTWVDLILKPMLKPLKKILKKGRYVYKFHIIEIKEKYGELCFYYAPVPAKITQELNQLIMTMADKSTQICEDCGRPSTCYTTDDVGYYCDQCKNRYIEQGRLHENNFESIRGVRNEHEQEE